MKTHSRSRRGRQRLLVLVVLFVVGSMVQAAGQTQQTVDVKIKDFTFVTNQAPLLPDAPTIITIRNEDDVRHDFGSIVFQNTSTEVESNGVVSYGRGIAGVFLDPNRQASIRFVIERPGRYEFRCSIHPKMRGELLLLNIGAV